METSPIRIRTATTRDAAVVTRFSLACALESEGLGLDAARVRAGVEAALRDGARGHYYLAGYGDDSVGQIMITREWSDWRNAWIWWVQSVYVERAARRRGVFTALLAHAEAAARRENAVLLRLYVDKDNAAAENTYVANGFEAAHYRMLEKHLPRD